MRKSSTSASHFSLCVQIKSQINGPWKLLKQLELKMTWANFAVHRTESHCFLHYVCENVAISFPLCKNEARCGMKRCATRLCGCLSSSFGGFLYAAACMFATVFTCPPDHRSDIYQRKQCYLDWHRLLPSKQKRFLHQWPSFCSAACHTVKRKSQMY